MRTFSRLVLILTLLPTVIPLQAQLPEDLSQVRLWGVEDTPRIPVGCLALGPTSLDLRSPIPHALPLKSTARARAYAAGATLGAGSVAFLALAHGSTSTSGLSVGLGAAAGTGAVLLGPSVGSFYAGDRSRGYRGALIRAGALGASVLGVATLLSDTGTNGQATAMLGLAGYLGGAGLLVVSSVYDVAVSSARSVEQHNRRILEAQGSPALGAVPPIEAPSGGAYGRGVGFALPAAGYPAPCPVREIGEVTDS